MENENLLLDDLERAVQEVEALQAIYQHDEDDDEDDNNNDQNHPSIANESYLIVKSKKELETSKVIIEKGKDLLQLDDIPLLEIEMQVVVVVLDDDDDEDNNNNNEQQQQTLPSPTLSARIYFGLPPGYPSSVPLNVTIVTAQQGMTRMARDTLGAELQRKANELVGAEAIMEVIQECQDQLLLVHNSSKGSIEDTNMKQEQQDANRQQMTKNNSLLGRRWIWVHHIKDKQRRDDIVHEAQELSLGGYLKSGYPGIVVIEGTLQSCNEFVIWIKGNKSRPGGFGRQWGHHVRGELIITERQLPLIFEEVKGKDDTTMSILASHCRTCHLEIEFLKFVMQHG